MPEDNLERRQLRVRALLLIMMAEDVLRYRVMMLGRLKATGWTYFRIALVILGMCFLQASCGGGSNSGTTTTPPPPPPTTRGAPQWTMVGNTGYVQTWGIIFDSVGNMYAASNNATTGGIAKSTDHGATWTPLTTGLILTGGCASFRSLGIAPDGTVFTMNQVGCTNGVAHAYYLDNVSGPGTTWTQATIQSPGVTYGMENGCAIAGNHTTIICPTGAPAVLLSNDNARSWSISPGSPTVTAEMLYAYTMPSGTTFLSFASRTGNTGYLYYTTNNGTTWNATPAVGTTAAGDAWTIGLAGAGTQAGDVLTYIGESGAGTGMWCYQEAGSTWTPCNTNVNQGQTQVDVTMLQINRTHDRTIAVKYEDAGAKPIYTDDGGSTWNDASAGLAPDSASTDGGAKTAYIQVDPTTGFFYISLKNGDIYRTTVSQD